MKQYNLFVKSGDSAVLLKSSDNEAELMQLSCSLFPIFLCDFFVEHEDHENDKTTHLVHSFCHNTD